jgi:hypothetical protein
MKFKKIMMFCVFYSFDLLQASQHTTSLNRTFPLTAEAIRIQKNKQFQALKNEPKKIEIGTIDVLHVQIDQLLLYQSNKHDEVETGGIQLDVFAQKYSNVIEKIKKQTQDLYALPPVARADIYANLNKYPGRRDVLCWGNHYVFVGIMPLNDGYDDAIYNVGGAKRYALELVQKHINDNYAEVNNNCNQPILPQIDSTKVLSTPCCSTQFHEKCLIRCRNYKVASCPNAQCQVAENGIPYAKSWNDNFYGKVLFGVALSRKEIASGTCMLCEDPLKLDMPKKSLLNTSKRRAVDFDLYQRNKK